MILAVVGSTLLAGNAEAERLIVAAFDRWKPDGFTSGDAFGIDRMAEAYARRYGIPEDRMFIFPARVKRWKGEGGFEERNLKIAQTCDALERIVASTTNTYGSGWTRDRASAMGKPTNSTTVHVE